MAEKADIEGTSVQGAERKPVILNGEYRFKVDGKGRLSLPAKFRKMLPSANLVVVRDVDDTYLSVYVNEDYEAWIDRLFEARFGGYNDASRSQVALHTKLKSRARDVEVDGSGRIMLPADAREKVGIEKDVVIVGDNGRFMVYDAKRYDELMDTVDLSDLYID